MTEGRFVSAASLPDQWGLNAVIYGHFGAGKTHMLGTAQDSEYGRDLLVLDIEGGTRTIADREDVQVWRITQWADLIDAYKFVRESDRFKTVGIDSLTELQGLCLEEVLKSSKTPDLPSLQDYGKVNLQMVRAVRNFRTLSQTKGINVIFTALQQEVQDESTGAVLIRPAMSPKCAEGVCGTVDVVAHLSIGKEGKRKLRTKQVGNVLAKVRQPGGGSLCTLPEQIEDPSMVKVFELFNNREVAVR